MLKKISATHSNSGKQYHFSFVRAVAKNILSISLGKFIEAYQTLDGEMNSLGSNEADRFCYIFADPDLGWVRVKVKSETLGEDIVLDIEYLDEPPNESDGNDVFLTKQ